MYIKERERERVLHILLVSVLALMIKTEFVFMCRFWCFLSPRLVIRFAHCNRIVLPDGEMPFTRFDLSSVSVNIIVIVVGLLVIEFRHILGLKIDICKYLVLWISIFS